MIIFDIDNTLSPAQLSGDWAEPHETERAWGFQVSIPSFLLDFLRSRDDIALLSTWGDGAADLAQAFRFNAEILSLTGIGIEGKFRTVMNEPRAKAWIDDHMTGGMKMELEARGVICVRPTKGYMTPGQLRGLLKKLS